MKPVIVLIALAAVGFYAYLGQDDIKKSKDAVVQAQQAADDARKKEGAADRDKQTIQDQIKKLQQQVTEAQAALEKEKELLAKAQATPAPAAAPVQVAVQAPKVEARPAPSLDQYLNRKNELGKGYYLLVLRDGTVLKNVTVTKIFNGEVFFTSPSGDVKVGRDNIPVEMVTRFGLNFDESPLPAADNSDNTTIVVQMPTNVIQSGNSNKPSNDQPVVIPGASAFGVPTNSIPADKTTQEKTITSVNDVKPLKGAMAVQISQLHAEADDLKAKADADSNADEAQKYRDQAAKLEQQAADLQASQ